MPDFLEQYKPKVSISDTFSVDESLDDKELSFDIWKKLITARNIQDITFLAIGRMLKIIRDRKLYTTLDYENFSQFLNSEELSFSREKAYLYIRTYELYVEKLQFNPDEIGKMGVVRLMMLAPIIKEIDNKEEAVEKIEEMGQMRYSDFVRKVKETTNKTGKPTVYFSEESGLWVINYYEDTTHLVPLGKFNE